MTHLHFNTFTLFCWALKLYIWLSAYLKIYFSFNANKFWLALLLKLSETFYFETFQIVPETFLNDIYFLIFDKHYSLAFILAYILFYFYLAKIYNYIDLRSYVWIIFHDAFLYFSPTNR